MSRYIDADALKKEVDNFQNCYNGWSDTYDKAFIIGAIEEQPSIDIVYCRECMWRDKDNQGEDYCIYVKGLADINDSSFCSWGKRKESE